MTPNYLRKHEFLEINSLCNECLLISKMTNNDEITAIITIDDFPSRPEIIALLRDYIKQNGNNSSYSCANRSNSLSITFHDSVCLLLFML